MPHGEAGPCAANAPRRSRLGADLSAPYPDTISDGWLTHMVSEGDHRMNQVQGWVAQRMQTLQGCTGQEVRAESWSDDRLALVLDALAQPEGWQRFETALDQRIIRVYQLQPQRVRLDSTTASGYWRVTEDGLFQLGYSKDHRPDLPQLKVMLSALDPLGLPLATQVVAGKAADDPLYIPAIKQVSQSLPEHGVLYVGDCKMAALSTRAYVQAQGDYYLCPLAGANTAVSTGVGPLSAAGVQWQATIDQRASGQGGGGRRGDCPGS
jgi:transposase